jgi:hypothetical protein
VQIVYLSARPAVLAATAASVRAHMPFIDRVLAVVPERLKDEVTGPGIEVLADEELLAGAVPQDHQRRNYALRGALAGSDAVADSFLMSDDDSRPLVDIDETTFITDGRYRRYTFGWLDEWWHRSTSFDEGQQATRQILGLLGFPRRAYASHMPQLIDKALLGEVVELLSLPAKSHPLCEWAAYFNVAPRLSPAAFQEPEPYLTLGWPENLAAWQATLEAGAFLFENYFPEHYREGAVYSGIDPDDHTFEASAEKVVRWRRYELEVLAGERPPIVGVILPSTTVGRSLRRVRSALVGDPVQRDRDQRAAWAAMLRASRRS